MPRLKVVLNRLLIERIIEHMDSNYPQAFAAPGHLERDLLHFTERCPECRFTVVERVAEAVWALAKEPRDFDHTRTD